MPVGVDNSAVDYVVESYNDGTNWYRVYKSGWVEQGITRIQDDTTFTFPIPMADDNFSVSALTFVGSGEVKAASERRDLRTSRSCVVYFSSNAYYGTVEVKGQGA